MCRDDGDTPAVSWKVETTSGVEQRMVQTGGEAQREGHEQPLSSQKWLDQVSVATRVLLSVVWVIILEIVDCHCQGKV